MVFPLMILLVLVRCKEIGASYKTTLNASTLRVTSTFNVINERFQTFHRRAIFLTFCVLAEKVTYIS